MNGTVTQINIHTNLQWMHDIGIGGIDVMSAPIAPPVVVKKPLSNIATVKTTFRHSAQSPGSHHIELGIDSAPGWCETRGPWIKRSQAIEKVICSTTGIEGGISVAHIYGRKLFGAESFDSVDHPRAFGPRQLNRVVNKEFLLGVNRIESAEQPINVRSGLSLSFCGQMPNRLDAWRSGVGQSIRYISWCSYPLAVTNLWVTRLIEDRQTGVRRKYTVTITATYEPDAPFPTSGLLDPARLRELRAN